MASMSFDWRAWIAPALSLKTWVSGSGLMTVSIASARRPDLGPELVGLEVRDRLRAGRGIALQGHDRLVEIVVALRQVDGSGPLLAERDLVDDEVVVLRPRGNGVGEGNDDPRDLVGGEAELLRDGIRDGGLEALAGGRIPGEAEVLPRRRVAPLADREVRRVGRVVGADRERAGGEGRQVLRGARVRRGRRLRVGAGWSGRRDHGGAGVGVAPPAGRQTAPVVRGQKRKVDRMGCFSKREPAR
jgi:hypothetical protein